MGEPLAKTILTLWICSCEEIAIREHLGRGFGEAIQVPWRAFADAGDDHIASGPPKYLDKIGEVIAKTGGILSPEKHARSRLAVRYCEKVLDVRNIKKSWSVKTINDGLNEYQASPFVDSIKVRLLSPCSKSNESFNDRNTAVGKAKSLGRTLRWLNPSVFPHKWVRMVRDRFFQRMGSLLPDNTSGVYWHLLLPEHLGGLGLYIEADFVDLPYRLPEPTKVLIKELCQGQVEPDSDKIRLFRGFTSNISYRGYELEKRDLELVQEFLIPMLKANGLGTSPSFSIEEAMRKEGLSEDLTYKSRISRLRARNYLTAWELEDLLIRPFLFKQILSREANVSAFNTEAFKRRYSKLWDLVYSGNVSVSEAEIRSAIATKLVDEKLYHLEQIQYFAQGEIKDGTVLDEVTAGLPNFKLHWSLFGELGKAIGFSPEGELTQDDFSLGEYV